jgi:hypothetical protein
MIGKIDGAQPTSAAARSTKARSVSLTSRSSTAVSLTNFRVEAPGTLVDRPAANSNL